MLDSILESLRVIELPTKTDFRSVTSREIALFEGPAGWGEFSPFLEYAPSECVPWLVSAIEAATVAPPQPIRSQIAINATLPAIDGERAISEVLSWYPGATAVKIKVGNNLEEDMARIAYTRKVLPDAAIRLDVNGHWKVNEALEVIKKISALGPIQYVEQPCATLAELRELHTKLNGEVLIAGDEVIRKSATPLALDLGGAIDILMLKVAPLGGIKRSLEIADLHKLPTVVSSALESAVGISHGLRLASVLPQLNFPCGLATGALLQNDIGSLPISGGSIELTAVRPNPLALATYAVPAERLAWWRERIRNTWVAGAQEWIAVEGWSW